MVDVDGDGRLDTVVGEPEHDGGRGRVRIDGGDGVSRAWAPEGLARGDQFGAALVVGDFDCDGQPELAVSAPGRRVGGSRAAGVVFRVELTVALERVAGALLGSVADGRFGEVLGSGDVDGDGCVDLLVGAPSEPVGTPGDPRIGAGEVYLLFGAPGGPSRDDEQPLRALVGRRGVAGARFGERVWAVDRDGDGDDEVVIMVPGDSCGPGTKGFDHLDGGPLGATPAEVDAWACAQTWR